MKRIISFFSVLFVTVVFGQATQTENYVETRVYLDPVTSTNTSARQVHTVQYFDGLGRPKQVVNVKASPTGKDVVNHIEYDQFGRQTRDYLPIPQQGTTNGQIYGSPLGNASTIYGSEKIYAEKILEASPLDRVLAQKQVGTDWQTHPVEFGYFANAANDVKKFVTTTTWTNNATVSVLKIDPSNSFYPANQLYKNKVTDEDDNVSYEFRNGQGQTLLVRKMLSAKESADTYYVYNEYDQLAFVIPPLASQSFKNLGVGTNISTTKLNDLNNLCYQYKYDGRNRLVEKKLPGKGWEWMVYDKQDRLVATKDSQNPWLFTKYDQFGRVVYTGLANLGTSRNTVQNNANNQGGNESRSSSTFNHSNMQIYYTNNVFPNGNFNKILSINYYDTYPTGSPAIPTTIINATQPTLGQNAQSSPISTKSLPTATYVKNIEDDNWTKTYSWYDQRGRVIGTHSINHLGGFTKTESLLDFAGAVQESNTYHSRASTSTEVTIHEEFEYDNQNRLKKHWHQVDSNAMVLLTENNYNELSQVTNKKVGDNIQNIEYEYNIRGWMTGINKNDIDDPLGSGKLFTYDMRYQNPESGLTGGVLNGNISEVTWNTGGNNITKKRYNYGYDGLNRLRVAFFSNPDETNPETHYNDEIVDYDLNGNITSLQRFARPLGGYNADLIDELEYHYSGNKVTSINDGANNPTGYEGGGGKIDYDSNGNMILMEDKSVDGIAYNHLNLPNVLMAFGGEKKLLYLYRADGVKLRKIHNIPNGFNGGFSSYTEYIDGFHYLQTEGIVNNNEDPYGYAYEQEAFINLIFEGEVNPILKFFPTAEGFFDYENNEYIYQYKDHLGNVRISYNSGGKITDQNDYYPFGMNIPREEESIVGTASLYNYKYNGKELQETGMYDYGARFYMPDIGRWGVVDNYSELGYDRTPFGYVSNNPIMKIDPDGNWEDWYEDADGSYVYDAELTKENASTKLNGNQKYLGESKDVTLIHKGQNVGNMHLGSNGDVKLTGSWANSGVIKTAHLATAVGNVTVTDIGLANGAKVYGADVFSYENGATNPNGSASFEFNARLAAESSPSTLMDFLNSKIEKFDKQREIFENSQEEGSAGDPSNGRAFGSIYNSADRNYQISKVRGYLEELQKMKSAGYNDSIQKREIIHNNPVNPSTNKKPTMIQIPKSNF